MQFYLHILHNSILQNFIVLISNCKFACCNFCLLSLIISSCTSDKSLVLPFPYSLIKVVYRPGSPLSFPLSSLNRSSFLNFFSCQILQTLIVLVILLQYVNIFFCSGKLKTVHSIPDAILQVSKMRKMTFLNPFISIYKYIPQHSCNLF